MKASPALPARLRFYYKSLPTIQVKNVPSGKMSRVPANGDWECEIDPSGHYAYSLNSSFYYLHQWRIDTHGVLRPLAPHQVAAHSHPTSLQFHPSGRFAYVSCSHGAICQYRVRAGALIPLKPAEVSASKNPTSLWFDRTGNYACALTPAVEEGHPFTDRVHIYRVGKEGHLELLQKIEVRGPRSKISSAALAGKLASFTVSGDTLGR